MLSLTAASQIFYLNSLTWLQLHPGILLAIPVWSSAVSVTYSTTSLIETVTIGVNWLVAAPVVGASVLGQAGGQVINGVTMVRSLITCPPASTPHRDSQQNSRMQLEPCQRIEIEN